MIGDLSRWLEARLKAQVYTAQRDVARDAHDLQLASAALLVEAALADQAFGAEEQVRLLALLREKHALSAEEAEQFAQRARHHSAHAVSLTELTQVVNRHCNQAERKQLLIEMWKIALADGRIDKYEEYIIRQVAGLMYVPHEDYIHARLLAQGEG